MADQKEQKKYPKLFNQAELDELDKSVVTLAVKRSVQIPHKVNYKGEAYVFEPTAEVPGGFAAALLHNYPQTYFEVEKDDKGAYVKVTNSGYTYRDDFKNFTVTDYFSKMSDPNKAKTLTFMRKLLEEQATPVKPQAKAPMPSAPVTK